MGKSLKKTAFAKSKKQYFMALCQNKGLQKKCKLTSTKIKPREGKQIFPELDSPHEVPYDTWSLLRPTASLTPAAAVSDMVIIQQLLYVTHRLPSSNPQGSVPKKRRISRMA